MLQLPYRASHLKYAIRNNCFGLNINDGTAEKLERTFGLEKEESNTRLDDILALKKETKENGFITLKECLNHLRQSIKHY